MSTGKSQRKSFLFPHEALQLIDWLKGACRVSTDSEVVRLGIGCLADLMVADKSGAKIIIQTADGVETRYHPVFDLEEEDNEAPEKELQKFRASIRRKKAA